MGESVLWILAKLWCETIVREGMEERTRDDFDDCKNVVSDLRHDNATCLSSAV